jgi:hypothetical protein
MFSIFKNTHKIIISFLILAITSLGIVYLKNNHREIIQGPDDHYHYLMKPSNLKLCKNEKCFFENLYKYTEKESLDVYQKWNVDRQIHRIVVSYHPLYTFIIDKISNKENLFKVQFIVNIIGTIITLIFLLIYSNKFLTNKNILIIISIILATHQYSYYAGIQHFVSFILASFIGALGMITQYQNKLLSYIFYIVCILLHKVGLLITLISFSVYYIDNLSRLIEEKKYLNKILIFFKKEIYHILLFFIIFITCFFVEYDFNQDEKINIFSTYNTNNSLNSILLSLKANYTQVFMRTWDTFILRINPLLFPFFIASFVINLPQIYRPLKIFTVVLICSCIIFIYGIQHNALGARIWPLLVTNYLILSFVTLYELSKSYRLANITKYFIIITIPIFIYININQNIKEINASIVTDNYYFDSENISEFKNDIIIEDKNFIYFNTSEATLYYYLISGFVNKNFITSQTFPKLDKIYKKISYVIKDNPLNILINNNTKIDITNPDINLSDLGYRLVLLSGKKQEIEINNSIFQVKSGKNSIKIKDLNLNFNRISGSLRLIGLVLNEKQEHFWPWDENIKLEYSREDYMPTVYHYNKWEKQTYILPDLIEEIKSSNMVKGFGELEETKFSKCNQKILSDVDSSLIFRVNCS